MTTRYAIKTSAGNYLMACYEPEGSGIVITSDKTEACTWVTIEKAAEVCRYLRKVTSMPVVITSVMED